MTVATLAPDEYPPEAGQEFFADFETSTASAGEIDPYAIYGYEAMRLALDAIERSGDASKESIIKALFDTKDRESVLGTYSIDENGDTTLTDYGVYTIKDGKLVFDKAIKARHHRLNGSPTSGRGGDFRSRPVAFPRSTEHGSRISIPVQAPVRSARSGEFISEVRPDRVLLSLPVVYGIQDLRTTATSRASATTSSTASPTAPSGRWWRSATRSSTASSS